eukprot:SAG31_NODE_29353_length_396_cov_1.228956_1_plen_75_part_01
MGLDPAAAAAAPAAAPAAAAPEYLNLVGTCMSLPERLILGARSPYCTSSYCYRHQSFKIMIGPNIYVFHLLKSTV